MKKGEQSRPIVLLLIGIGKRFLKICHMNLRSEVDLTETNEGGKDFAICFQKYHTLEDKKCLMSSYMLCGFIFVNVWFFDPHDL